MRMALIPFLATLALLAALDARADAEDPTPTVMTVAEALALDQPAADHRVPYGPHEPNFGELRLPAGKGPFPVAIVIHGGCWLADFDLGYISSLADALTLEGLATWSVEYRRVGDDGGGWPGTFTDVAAAADALRSLAAEHPLDLERVVAVGHSAGGHLALWLAARSGLPADDPLRGEDPLGLAGVVSLAGIPDLAGYSSDTGCGAAVPGLLGGDPEAHPERLLRASPIEMPPSGSPETLIIGARDTIVPRSQADDYRSRNDRSSVKVVEVSKAGHFELVVPEREAWNAVRDAVLTVIR